MNYIDLTCPAEIFRTALPTGDIPAATLTLFNLSDRVISSVEVSLRLLDDEDGETERLAFRGRALNGRPHSTFLLTVPCAPSPLLKKLEATVEKVWFADNEVWRRNPKNAVPYEPNNLPVSPALTRLKYSAGETAVGYPSMQSGLWVCVCGRPNPEGECVCARCGQQKEVVFTRFSPEAVDAQITMKVRQLDLSSRNMREDTIRMQRIREEEYLRKKARRGTCLRLLFAMALVAALTAGSILYFSPLLRLAAGHRALDHGDPAGAKANFLALGTFGNAESLIPDCDLQIAVSAVQTSKSPEEMAEASAALRAISDRPEALEKANETDLLRGRLLLGSGRWAEALEALTLLPEDYAGRAELERDCRMQQACTLMNDKRYGEAREIFLSLGDYPGAREQATLCLYNPAKEHMEDRDWDGAITMLNEILDYLDSRTLTLECHYRKALELLDAGDLEGAGNEFLLADNWGDAQDQYKKLIYDRAEALYKAGNLEAAQPLYASIPDYRDANARDQSCRYFMAKEAADDLEYTLALDLLRGIPDDYGETKTLREDATYGKAKIAFRQEEWLTAAELLRDLDRESLRKKYRDIENIYLEACEKAGIEAYPATPEPEAEPTPAPETSPEKTPEPGQEQTPEPGPEQTPRPGPDQTPEPDSEPTEKPGPAQESTPEPGSTPGTEEETSSPLDPFRVTDEE